MTPLALDSWPITYDVLEPSIKLHREFVFMSKECVILPFLSERNVVQTQAYFQVAQALSYSEALAEGLSMFQEYVNSFRAALEAASIEAGEANDGDALDGIMQPGNEPILLKASLLITTSTLRLPVCM